MAKKKKSFMTPKASRRKARKKRSTTTGRKKKEFTYRGYEVEELKAMPLWPSDEDPEAPSVVTLLPSRARRSLARGLSTENEHFITRVRRSTGRTVRTHRRDVPILPEFVGKRIAIHDGQKFVEIEVKPEMIGHYLGEFAPTRRGVTHSGPGVGATRSSAHVALK
jgi:small subunit ribosomal protein S19